MKIYPLLAYVPEKHMWHAFKVFFNQMDWSLGLALIAVGILAFFILRGLLIGSKQK